MSNAIVLTHLMNGRVIGERMTGLIGNTLGGVFIMSSAQWPNWSFKLMPTLRLVPSALRAAATA